MGMDATDENVVILDFGAQYTQLIARRVRECHVYSEILPFDTLGRGHRGEAAARDHLLRRPVQRLRARRAACRIPASTIWVFLILGICYGQQLMAYQLGGEVQPAERREVRPCGPDDPGSVRRCSSG